MHMERAQRGQCHHDQGPIIFPPLPPEPNSVNKYIIFYEMPKFGEVWITSQKLKSKKSRPFDLNITLPFTIIILLFLN